MKYSFTLVLAEKEITQELEDRLFEAGCDDALISISNGGTMELDFDREAETFSEALDSAIADVKKAGFGEKSLLFRQRNVAHEPT